MQLKGVAVQADPSSQHAERNAAFRGLVQQLAGLNVHDKQAVQQLAAEVLGATSGEGGGSRVTATGASYLPGTV